MSLDITSRMTKLNESLRYHSQKYHQEDNPEINDFEYDLLFNELKQLEETHPDLILANSITKEIGYKIKKGFYPFTHPILMGSLDNAMSLEEINDFIIKRNKDLGTMIKKYFLSLKLDGLALELIYQNGKLVVASTRGDGEVGENITRNALQVNNIPAELSSPCPTRLIIRGEVVMTKKFFEELNLSLKENDETPFANPRNAAAGTMRQLDETIVKKRKLYYYPYALTNWEECLDFIKGLNRSFDTHEQQMNYIGHIGFTLNPYTALVHNFSEITSFCKNIQKQRYELDYEIDGVVIKVNSGKEQNALGMVGRRPRYAIAWKLPPEIKKTVIEDIVFQVGRTGKITPVAILKPVRLAGVNVRRATLHNFSEVKEKDIHIHDTVKVIRSGDVIPHVLGVVKENRDIHSKKIKKIIFPEDCPVCNTPIETEENGILSFCRNHNCPSRQYHHMIHFASKDALNIEGLGKELIQELIQNGKLKDVGDIFLLQNSDLNVLKRVGDKLKANLFTSIERAKNTTLSRFLYALGIPTVGEKTAKILARKFQTLDNLMEQNQETLMEIDEIGEVMANHIYNYFSYSNHRKLIHKLINIGIRIRSPKEVANKKKKLFNKKILFTGSLKIPRRRAKELAEEAGALIVSSVSSSLDYLIVGENPGSKRKKAENLHIKIINEEKFLNLIND